MTTHTDRVKGESQCERLLRLLKNKKWNDTPSIQKIVYGAEHLGRCNIPGRVYDLKKRGYDIESKPVGKRTVWTYRLIGSA